MTMDNKPWEPDPRKLGNWTEMFEPKAREPSPPAAVVSADDFDDADLPGIDPRQYEPWVLLRIRPAIMLELRRFEAKSGLWRGWALSYPSLYAVDYIGDRLVTLDFGERHFAIEGRGLDELVRKLQIGRIAALQEYAASIWSEKPSGPVITAIRHLTEKTPQP